MENEVIIYEDAKWGKVGEDIVPSRFYQAYKVEGPWLGDDESTWYEFDSEDKSEIALDPVYANYEVNKWGLTADKEEVMVTVTANAKLSTDYPYAQVKIDGKFYDLNYLKNPVKFYMDKDHRISIIWSPELVENFRINKLK